MRRMVQDEYSCSNNGKNGKAKVKIHVYEKFKIVFYFTSCKFAFSLVFLDLKYVKKMGEKEKTKLEQKYGQNQA